MLDSQATRALRQSTHAALLRPEYFRGRATSGAHTARRRFPTDARREGDVLNKWWRASDQHTRDIVRGGGVVHVVSKCGCLLTRHTRFARLAAPGPASP